MGGRKDAGGEKPISFLTKRRKRNNLEKEDNYRIGDLDPVTEGKKI